MHLCMRAIRAKRRIIQRPTIYRAGRLCSVSVSFTRSFVDTFQADSDPLASRASSSSVHQQIPCGKESEEINNQLCDGSDRARRRSDSLAEWLNFLEIYLPLHLRSYNAPKYHAPGSEPEQCRRIHAILNNGRRCCGIDLLAYMSVHQERWSAVFAIHNKLLDNFDHLIQELPKNGPLTSDRLPIFQWRFRDITGPDWCKWYEKRMRHHAFPFNNDEMPLSVNDSYTQEPLLSNQMGSGPNTIGTMDELWPSLGSVVIEAADAPSEKSRMSLSHVHRILARIHHLGLIPSHVYKYAPPGLQSDMFSHRPPTLQLLQTRMMTVLSGAVITSEQDEETSADFSEAPKSPFAYEYRERELGVEIWLEFIIWCCIEGGFFREASWILRQLQKRENKWFVGTIPKELYYDPSVVAFDKIDYCHTWGQCAATHGFPDSIPKQAFAGIANRTISRNCVMAVMNGLADILQVGVGHRGETLPFITSRMSSLCLFLKENGLSATTKESNHLMNRLLDSGGIIPKADPRALDLLLQNECAPLPSSSMSINGHEYPVEESTLTLGLHHHLLNLYARSGNIFAAEKVMQTLVHAMSRIQGEQVFSPRQLFRYLPPTCLALLINASIISGPNKIAETLIMGSDISPPIVSVDMYSNVVLAPSLLRYAGIAKDPDLLRSVSLYHSGKWPTSAIKALLEYTAGDNDWNNTESLLRFIRDERPTHWGVSQVSAIAASIIRLDKQVRDNHDDADGLASLRQAILLFAKVLQGRYNAVIELSDGTPYVYQEVVLFQLHKLFYTIPGSLADLSRHIQVKRPPIGSEYRNMPNDAFNRILSAVVETQGSAVGQRLWERWCIDPWNGSSFYRRMLDGGNLLLYWRHELDSRLGGTEPYVGNAKMASERFGKLVYPNLSTVRIIAQQAARELDAAKDGSDNNELPSGEDARLVLGWSKLMFRKFRLSDREIDLEFANYSRQLDEERIKAQLNMEAFLRH